MSSSQKTDAIILRSSVSLSLTREEYQSILGLCIPSEEIRAYLTQCTVGKRELSEIIRNAPLSLYEKASLMESLIPKENLLYDLLCSIERWQSTSLLEYPYRARWVFEDSLFFQHKMMLEAIEAFESSNDAVFNLVEKWYDDELLDEKSSSGAPFLSSHKAIDYIRLDMEECDFDEAATAWYEIEKWVADDDGNLELRYTFTLIGCVPVFCHKHRSVDSARSLEAWDLYSPSGLLNIPLPYDTGDIVLIDCLPFAPPKPALIIEGPNWDTCFPTMLSQNQRGKWNISSLKQGYFSNGAAGRMLPLSPCYRLRNYIEPLACDEQILCEVQRWLRSDPKRGPSLWNAHYLFEEYELTPADIRQLMGMVENDETGTTSTSAPGV